MKLPVLVAASVAAILFLTAAFVQTKPAGTIVPAADCAAHCSAAALPVQR